MIFQQEKNRIPFCVKLKHRYMHDLMPQLYVCMTYTHIAMFFLHRYMCDLSTFNL